MTTVLAFLTFLYQKNVRPDTLSSLFKKVSVSSLPKTAGYAHFRPDTLTLKPDTLTLIKLDAN